MFVGLSPVGDPWRAWRWVVDVEVDLDVEFYVAVEVHVEVELHVGYTCYYYVPYRAYNSSRSCAVGGVRGCKEIITCFLLFNDLLFFVVLSFTAQQE